MDSKPITWRPSRFPIPRGYFFAGLGVILFSWAGLSPVLAQSRTDAVPTYLRDVQPILMRRCARCHNEQARFVYNWLDYRTATEDRGEIARRVWDSWKGTYFK